MNVLCSSTSLPAPACDCELNLSIAMLCTRVVRIQIQRLSPRLARRSYHSTTECLSKTKTPSKDTKSSMDESKLKWTERKEAPKWLQRIAPTKGGTKLPTPVEAALIAVVSAVGYYAWFVDPPKRAAAIEEEQR